jgi:hypothetical protein
LNVIALGRLGWTLLGAIRYKSLLAGQLRSQVRIWPENSPSRQLARRLAAAGIRRETGISFLAQQQAQHGPVLKVRGFLLSIGNEPQTPPVGTVEMRMSLLVPIAVTAATPLCLLKLVATFLRLAAVLTVAVNCLAEIFLGLVDALVALAVVIARLRARHAARQQQYS